MDPDEVNRLAIQWRAGTLSGEELASLINTIATMGIMQFIPDIEVALDHPDLIVRINALQALWFAFTSDRRLDRILELFNSDEDEEVRCEAACTLAYIANELDHPEIREVLENAARDPEQPPEVRAEVSRVLLRYAPARVTDI